MSSSCPIFNLTQTPKGTLSSKNAQGWRQFDSDSLNQANEQSMAERTASKKPRRLRVCKCTHRLLKRVGKVLRGLDWNQFGQCAAFSTGLSPIPTCNYVSNAPRPFSKEEKSTPVVTRRTKPLKEARESHWGCTDSSIFKSKLLSGRRFTKTLETIYEGEIPKTAHTLPLSCTNYIVKF